MIIKMASKIKTLNLDLVLPSPLFLVFRPVCIATCSTACSTSSYVAHTHLFKFRALTCSLKFAVQVSSTQYNFFAEKKNFTREWVSFTLNFVDHFHCKVCWDNANTSTFAFPVVFNAGKGRAGKI